MKESFPKFLKKEVKTQEPPLTPEKVKKLRAADMQPVTEEDLKRFAKKQHGK